jgi:hypothetical protein
MPARIRLALSEGLFSKAQEKEVPSSKSICNSAASELLRYSFKHFTIFPTISVHSIMSSDISNSPLNVGRLTGSWPIITLIVCRLIVVMIEVWRGASYFHQVSFRLKNTEPSR